MTEKRQPDMHEALSALADGETTEWELRKLLQLTEEDEGVRQRWQSYQLISSALRRDYSEGEDISASVSARLAEERAGVAGWLVTARRPLAQTAIAASVAAVAVMGLQQYQLASVDPVEPRAEVAGTTTTYNSPAPIRLPEGFAVPQTVSTGSSSSSSSSNTPVQVLSVKIPLFDREELRQHFESSLTDHSQNASEATQLILPQARIPQASQEE